MKFSEVCPLLQKAKSEKEFIDSNFNVFNNTPSEVISQLYCGLACNNTIIGFYGNINIESLLWKCISLSAEHIIQETSYYPYFAAYVNEIEEEVTTDGFNAYSLLSREVTDGCKRYWEKHKTWQVSPVFINGTILTLPMRNLHLIEGHTRLGILKGLLNKQLISHESPHKIFWGDIER